MYRPGLFILTTILSCGALAQAADPDAPQPKAEAPRAQHRFFDVVNDSGIAAAAIPIIGDSLSTQHFLETGSIKEGNPLARPFVGSRTGQAFISGVGFGSVIGGMYLFHRLEGRAGDRHPRKRFIYSLLERATPGIVSAVEFDRWHHNDVLIQQTKQSTQ
ncbi:MAG TPA: hypothetical protein VKW06_00200 [Candidatus Angelobacter sp.]|nr:hypothetical protein [Candidatus Angelobacter sp.]